jgi:hypothetical protein
MSEVTLFQQEVPAYLKRAGMDDLTKSLAGNTGLKRISIRGGVFRMMVNGEEIAKNEGRAMNSRDRQWRQKNRPSVLCW